MNLYPHFMIYGYDPDDPIYYLHYNFIGVATEDSLDEAMQIAKNHASKFADNLMVVDDEDEQYIYILDADNPDYEQPLAFICHHDHYREMFEALMEARIDEEIDELIAYTQPTTDDIEIHLS